MSMPPKEDHHISLETAIIYTQRFRAQFPDAALGFAMTKEIYQEIINQPNCVYIRTYNGIDDAGLTTIVVVGADANGLDITAGVIADKTYRNPPYSGGASPLNS